jgi:surface antigen
MLRTSLPKEMVVVGVALTFVAAAWIPVSKLLNGGLPWRGGSMIEQVLPASQVHFVPYGIDRGICDRGRLAADLPGSSGGGRGAIGSTLVGYAAGAKMDVIDQNCVGRILEFAVDSRRVYWRNGDSGFTYAVVPTRTFQDTTGAYCREYHTSASHGSLLHQIHGIACRRTDGSWRLAS